MTTIQRAVSIISVVVTAVPIILFYAYAAAHRREGSLWVIALVFAIATIGVCVYLGYFSRKEQGNGTEG